MRQKGLQHVMVPTLPGTCFIMIQSYLSFGFFESSLYRPPHPGDAGQFGWRTIRGCVTQIKLGFRLCAQRTAKERPATRAGQLVTHGRHAYKGQLDPQRAFAAFLDDASVPRSRRQLIYQCTQFHRSGCAGLYTWMKTRSSHWTAARRLDRRTTQPDACVGRHLGQIPLAQGCDSIQKCGNFPVTFITGDPAERKHIALYQIANHLQTQLRLRVKAQHLWNFTRFPPLPRRIAKPLCRHIQAFVQKRIALPTGIHQEDPFLAISDLSQMSTVLAGHAHRVSPIFGKTTPINDDHSILFPKPTTHQTLRMDHQRCAVPCSTSNELLHPANGIRIRTDLCQHHRFYGFALQIRQLTTQITQRPVPLFAAFEHGLELTMKCQQLIRTHVYLACTHFLRWLTPTGRWPARGAAVYASGT